MITYLEFEKMPLKKGAWSEEEDQLLIAYINRYGIWNWNEMPKAAGLLRTGKSCRLRWMNYLRPDIKHGNFSKEEDETIISLHQLLGNRWTAIAAKLPGRTDNEIKNHWHSHLKKRLNTNSPLQENEKFQDQQTSQAESNNGFYSENPTSSNSENSNGFSSSSDLSSELENKVTKDQDTCLPELQEGIQSLQEQSFPMQINQMSIDEESRHPYFSSACFPDNDQIIEENINLSRLLGEFQYTENNWESAQEMYEYPLLWSDDTDQSMYEYPLLWSDNTDQSMQQT